MTPQVPILVSIVHPDALVRACLAGALAATSDIGVNLAVPDATPLHELVERHALSHATVAGYDAGIELGAGAHRAGPAQQDDLPHARNGQQRKR